LTQLDLAAPRDRILDIHAQRRRYLIALADIVAHKLAANEGAVCMPRVIRELRANGHGAELDAVDPRWTGAVLLPSRGWERTGEIVREGSRARPVPMWRRAR
jgi:hypothetical protein